MASEVPAYWGAVRAMERAALGRRETIPPTRHRHGVQWDW